MVVKTADAAQVLLWKLETNRLPPSKYHDEIRDFVNSSNGAMCDLVCTTTLIDRHKDHNKYRAVGNVNNVRQFDFIVFYWKSIPLLVLNQF